MKKQIDESSKSSNSLQSVYSYLRCLAGASGCVSGQFATIKDNCQSVRYRINRYLT